MPATDNRAKSRAKTAHWTGPARALWYGCRLVRRGTRRWGIALVAVLVGTLLGAGGSALGQPQAPQAYRIKVDAVAYSLPGKTAYGIRVRKGVVAVDPKLIPLGTKLHIPGYGPGIAADVGHAIKGRIIDLCFPTLAKARQWGRRTVTITVYRSR
jgi:3D (Asp-Asp-Asp) domain-containing protein